VESLTEKEQGKPNKNKDVEKMNKNFSFDYTNMLYFINVFLIVTLITLNLLLIIKSNMSISPWHDISIPPWYWPVNLLFILFSVFVTIKYVCDKQKRRNKND